MSSQASDKLPRQAEAAAKKASALLSRLAKQHARIIAAANQISRIKGRSGAASSAFLAGAKFGAALLGRPKTSIRAKSADGKEVFHFRVTPVSRGSTFTNMISGRSARKETVHGDSPMSSSGAHQAYIEREAAVERARASTHPDRTAAEAQQLLMTPDERGYAAAAAAYIDRDTGVVVSSFGNIAENLSERIAFWHAVEQAEQRPATHKITINPGIDTGFWDHVASDDNAPDYLKKIASMARDTIVTEKLREKEAKEIYEYFLIHRTAKAEDAQTLSFEPGRGGRVQTRVVMELPSDMTAAQRLEIAKTFCDKEFQQKGVRFHCAIHSPTKANDERNYHFHVTFHDRPTDRMIDPSNGKEVWDFEIIETKKRANRNIVSKRPNQKDKIREFQDQKWMYKIRRDYADIVNTVRKNHNMPPIYDHRSYKEMGIEVDAVPSLTRKEFHDVQKGVENTTAASKIEKRWNRALFKDADESKLELPNKNITRRYQDLIAAVAKRAPASIVTAKAAHGAYLDAIRRINDSRLDRIALAIAIKKELSALTPEIGSPSAAGKQQAALLNQLHEYLAKPLEVHEQLARQSQQLAIEKLTLLERQLKTISRGSLSLPGRSFGDLAGRAGLSSLYQMLQSANDQTATTDQKPIAKPKAPGPTAPTHSPPQITAANEASEKATAAPIAAPTPPVQAPAAPPPVPRPEVVPERARHADPQMWRIRPVSRNTTPLQPPKPDPKRNVATQAVQGRPAAQPTAASQTPDGRQVTAAPTPAQTRPTAFDAKAFIKQMAANKPSRPTAVSNPPEGRRVTTASTPPNTRTNAIDSKRENAAGVIPTKTQLGTKPSPLQPPPQSGSHRTIVKSDPGDTKPRVPSPNPAPSDPKSPKPDSLAPDHKSTIRRTVAPISTAAAAPTHPAQPGLDTKNQPVPKKDRDSTRSDPMISRTPQPLSNPKKSSPTPEIESTDSPKTPPTPPAPATPAPDAEAARKEKERRERRRAILTTPQRPPRGRGGHER